MMQGSTYGFEAWGNYQVTRDWRLSAGWTELRENLRLKPGSLDPTGSSALGNDPKYQLLLHSAVNITEQQELDFSIRHVGALPDPVVPSYTAVDARYAWKLRRDLEVSIAAQNLFAQNHVEFGSLPTRSEIPSGVYLKLLWKI